MPRDDYEAISKIIEEVVGKDTLVAVKLLEGIKFYFENKPTEVKIIRQESTIKYRINSTKYKKNADEAMKRYTEKLNKENIKLRKEREETCAING
jgi:hypothetical protein